MNLLAHLQLSDRLSTVAMAGNLTADFCKEPGSMEFQRGVWLHRQIDSFTDSHEVMAQARALFTGDFRRFGGILADLVMDLCLANTWEEWQAGESRATFIATRLKSISERARDLPAPSAEAVEVMITHRWMQRYETFEGMGNAIRRITMRRPKVTPMLGAEAIMESHYDAFLTLFRSFYPELRKHVASVCDGSE